jgi:hypothetical protein
MAALLGIEVINKEYKKIRIKIAYHPTDKKFEVANPAIEKDASWIPDIAVVFDPKSSIFEIVQKYCKKNSLTNQDVIFKSLEQLRGITSNQIGLIELSADLDIETVTDIFIRVNQQGVTLSQADFAMSKIAVNEKNNGNVLRKAIDYFCHMSKYPEFHEIIKQDKEFCKNDYYKEMVWLKNEKDDLYDPEYTDMLRVAFTSEFQRGKMQDLVALLSGRNFETRKYEESIVESSFQRLSKSISGFMNETHFKRFTMIIRSSGFIDQSLIGSQNALNFAYILYLTLRLQKIENADIEKYVRRWFVLSILTGRYSGSPESQIDYDIKQIHNHGIEKYANATIKGELSDAFWDSLLLQRLETSVSSSPYFCTYIASQVKMNDKGFLSKDITIKDLIENKSDVHHIFPKKYLKENGMSRGEYNQIANYVLAQSEINISIGYKEPKKYFCEVLKQCDGGKRKYGNIEEEQELKENFKMNCIPEGIEDMAVENFQEFLVMRRKLMASKIKDYFKKL